MTRTAYIKLIKIVGTSIIAVLIIAFAIWRSLDYTRGPNIIVSYPANGAEITEKFSTLEGQIERANNLLINGREINIDEKGAFKDDIVIFPGINVITVTAKDQFGRSVEDQLTLVGNDASTSTSITI
jgi:hypothetical protein